MIFMEVNIKDAFQGVSSKKIIISFTGDTSILKVTSEKSLSNTSSTWIHLSPVLTPQ